MNSNSSTDCPICGAESRALIEGTTPFRHCPECGLLWKDPSVFPDRISEKSRYESHSSVCDAGYVRWVEEFRKEAVDPFASGGDALDFGCGRQGELARQLRAHGFAVWEYDPVFADHRDLLARPYDFVTALEVVEHFHDPAASWNMLASLLRPGGHLAVHTSFLPKDWKRWWYLRDVTHTTFYPDSCWEKLASRFGWEIRHNNHRDCIVFQRQGT